MNQLQLEQQHAEVRKAADAATLAEEDKARASTALETSAAEISRLNDVIRSQEARVAQFEVTVSEKNEAAAVMTAELKDVRGQVRLPPASHSPIPLVLFGFFCGLLLSGPACRNNNVTSDLQQYQRVLSPHCACSFYFSIILAYFATLLVGILLLRLAVPPWCCASYSNVHLCHSACAQ
jgi:hypothetical protein